MLFVDYVKSVSKLLSFLATPSDHIHSDFMSFYNEILQGDVYSYIVRYMRVHVKTLNEAVDELVEKILKVTESVREILGEGRAREAWESFASGYVHFHLYCSRYQLEEVVPEYF